VGSEEAVLAFHDLRQRRTVRLVTERKGHVENALEARIRGKKMTKRNLFAEMTEGFDALAAARKGKKTLRTTEVSLKPVVEISAEELRAIREKLNLSRPVFAGYLRTNPRTLENWEQGRAKPNAQAALLIHLVSRYPDTVSRLSAV
jgi:putative transcriptional regulator